MDAATEIRQHDALAFGSTQYQIDRFFDSLFVTCLCDLAACSYLQRKLPADSKKITLRSSHPFSLTHRKYHLDKITKTALANSGHVEVVRPNAQRCHERRSQRHRDDQRGSVPGAAGWNDLHARRWRRISYVDVCAYGFANH